MFSSLDEVKNLFIRSRNFACPVIAYESCSYYDSISNIQRWIQLEKEENNDTLLSEEELPVYLRWSVIEGFSPLYNDEASIKYCDSKNLTEKGYLKQPDFFKDIKSVLDDITNHSLLIIEDADTYFHEFKGAANAAFRAKLLSSIRNIHNSFKLKGATLVLMGYYFDISSDFSEHIVYLNEPLPNHEDLTDLVHKIYKTMGMSLLGENDLFKYVFPLRGCSLSVAENLLALSFDKGVGINLKTLWKLKEKDINATAGLSYTSSNVKLGDIAGLYALKEWLIAILTAKNHHY